MGLLTSLTQASAAIGDRFYNAGKRLVIAEVLDAAAGRYVWRNDEVVSVNSTDELALVPAVKDQIARIVNSFEEGFFVFDSSDLSAKVTADPQKGLYVAPSTATTGASGAWVRVVADNFYLADWWLKGTSTLVQDIINRALKLIPSGSELRLPPREMTITRAAAGSVNRQSSNLHSGVVSAIYIDKPSITLSGFGNATHLNGEGGALHCIIARDNNCRVKNLRAGNCKGNLQIGESAGCVFEASNFVQGNTGLGEDKRDFIVSDCEFYNCDTGFSCRPARNFNTDADLWRVSDVIVENCRMFNIARQGIEFFQSEKCLAIGNVFTGGDKGVNIISRFVRIIGSRKVKVIGNTALGFSQGPDIGYLGVEISTSGHWAYVPHYEICADVIITNNTFERFGVSIECHECQGTCIVANNSFENDYGTDPTICMRILSVGLRDPAGNATDLANKNVVEEMQVYGNKAKGHSMFFRVAGRTNYLSIKDNLFISNNATSVYGVWFNVNAGHPLESVQLAEVIGNTCLVKPNSPAYRYQGAGADAIIYHDDNKTNGVFAVSDTGTVRVRDKYSNTTLSDSFWDNLFSPPPSRLFTGNI
jgi:hypothetical protein